MAWTRVWVLGAAVMLAAVGGWGCGGEREPAPTGGGGGAGAPTAQDQRVHICPMRCVKPGETQPYTQRGPGSCPVCGMALVPQ